MTFQVLKDNAPPLLEVSSPVEVFDASLTAFADELLLTMIAYRGIGIAAPQVGKNIRLIIVLVNSKPIAMVNPKIVTKSGFYISKEGCLSVPGRLIQKTRSKNVNIRYQTLDGTEKSVILNGLEAACVQHEIDHLNGILITS